MKRPVIAGWVIYDTERRGPYIDRVWQSEAVARRELADLLRPYAPEAPWRARLVVQRWNQDGCVAPREAQAGASVET